MQSVDCTFTLAARAVELMKLYGETASPHSYELWFTFLTGLNPELNLAVGAAIAARRRLSYSDIESLYRAHLSNERLIAETDRVGAGVAGEMDLLMEVIRRTLDSASHYERSLRNLVDDVPAESGSPARPVLKALLEATREVSQANRALEARLQHSKAEIEQLRASLDAVRHEAVTDSLTGLANRRHFETALSLARDAAIEEGAPLALILVDIDHFKRFNDLYGHVTGDQVLRLVGSVMRAALPAEAVLARFGGEEFVVVLPGMELFRAVTCAEDIRGAIERRHLLRRSSGESLGQVTISLGVVTLCGEEAATSLLERADRCLYEAKHAGRNRTVSERDLREPLIAQVA